MYSTAKEQGFSWGDPVLFANTSPSLAVRPGLKREQEVMLLRTFSLSAFEKWKIKC